VLAVFVERRPSKESGDPSLATFAKATVAKAFGDDMAYVGDKIVLELFKKFLNFLFENWEITRVFKSF
jgi:hypothetical protein